MPRIISHLKTYKREVAFLLLVNLCALVWMDKLQGAEIMNLPTFTFAALAFGMDWGSRQTNLTQGKKE